jgi:hypothetical protein
MEQNVVLCEEQWWNKYILGMCVICKVDTANLLLVEIISWNQLIDKYENGRITPVCMSSLLNYSGMLHKYRQ